MAKTFTFIQPVKIPSFYVAAQLQTILIRAEIHAAIFSRAGNAISHLTWGGGGGEEEEGKRGGNLIPSL